MWLPGPLYESLPYCYVLGGCLFSVGTYYNGFSAPGTILYLACSAISIVAGIVIFARRQAYRASAEQAERSEFG
jgi:hypothetical protein